MFFLPRILRKEKNFFREGSLNFFWSFLVLKVIFTSFPDNSVISHHSTPLPLPQPQLTDKRVKLSMILFQTEISRLNQSESELYVITFEY